jgi:1-acyl-sn-glycerol-3-phosphate acyltransferase
MIRSLFAGAAVVALTVVCGIPATILAIVHPSGDWVLRFGRVWARGICAASGVRVEAHGLESLPRGGCTILISNHQSHFDMIALLVSFPGSFRVVAKRFLFYIPVFGWCLWAAGMIPIDREKRASAIQSLEKAAERIRGGLPVLFFPEGTRSTDGALQPFKKGAFVIALKSGASIVPVSVSGSREILPKGSIRIRAGRVVIRYGTVIPLEGFTTENKESLIEVVRRAVAAGLAENAARRGEAPTST